MSNRIKFIIATIAAVFLVSAVRTGALIAQYPEVDIAAEDILTGTNGTIKDLSVEGSQIRAESNNPEIRITFPEAVPVYEIGIRIDNISRANCRSYIYLLPTYDDASILLKDGTNYWRFAGNTAGDVAEIRFNPVPLRAVSLDLEAVTINPHSHFILTGLRDAAIVAAALAFLEAILLALVYRRRTNGGWYGGRVGIGIAVLAGLIQTVFTGGFLYAYVTEHHSWDAFQTGFHDVFYITESLFVLMTVLPDDLSIGLLHKAKHDQPAASTASPCKRELPVIRILLLSIMSYALTEMLYSDYMQHWKPIAILCNPLAYALLYVLFQAIPFPRRYHLSGLCYALPNVLWMLAAGVNHYYYEFRAQALEFADISMAGTAGNVMGTYTLDVTPTVFIMYASAVAVSFAALTESTQGFRRRTLTRSLVSILYVGLAGLFLWTNAPVVSLWNTNTATKYNGYVYSFISYMKRSLERPVPEGYSAEEANAILAAYAEDDAEAADDAATQAVNLIVIMDEAFADLPTTYGFETNIDGLPFIHSLEGSNVKKGNLLVSVFGGTTADSEYEFLTGNSLAFLNADSVPYTQYIDAPMQSLATMFQARGVYSTAFHPYLPNGYKRNKIYSLLGFPQFVSSENNLAHYDKMRSYVSDASDYQDLIDIWNNARDGGAETASDGSGELTGNTIDASNGQFIFNVTMQNHGNYNSTESAVDVTVYPTDDLLRSPQIEEYLSLAYATDQAFEQLIAYYETVDEPTIILLFGDHQPGMDESVYKRLNPAMYEEDAPITELQKKYTVPYVIWANYDLPDLGDGDGLAVTSCNLLRSYYLENAGVELSAFDRLCRSVRQAYPAMNIKGYVRADGEWHTNDDLMRIEMMLDYSKVCYQNLFDQDSMDYSYYE